MKEIISAALFCFAMVFVLLAFLYGLVKLSASVIIAIKVKSGQ